MLAFRVPRFFTLGSLLLALGGCKSQTPSVELAPVQGESDLLLRRQPADIAVAPVQNLTEDEGAPTDLLRECLAQALVEKLYSPLDLEYVDGNWIESSFRGTPAPDGLLVVSLKRWDTSRLFSVGRVEAAADVYLYEGGSAAGTLYWGTPVECSIDLSDGRGVPRGPFSALVPEAARRFAIQALSMLPKRDPLLAPRH